MDVRAGPVAVPDAQAALVLVLALLGRVLELLRLRQSADALCAEGGATSDALDAALVQRARGLGAALRRWKDAWDALDPAHGAGSPVPACENAMPIYMVRRSRFFRVLGCFAGADVGACRSSLR